MPRPPREQSVVVLRALGLGDLLTGVPALRGLRAALPHDRIELVVSRGVAPLARLLEVADDVTTIAGLYDPAPSTAPFLAVNLHGSGPESHRWLLRTNPGSLLAFAHPSIHASFGGPAWAAEEHEVGRWCRLLGSAGIASDRDDLSIPAPADPLPADPDRVVVHVGAGAGARRWPPPRWVEVVRRLVRDGRTPWLTGDEEERPIALFVAEQASIPVDRVLAGRTDVVELAGVVSGARLILAGDTGVGHLATALGRPSVLLFGPTPPSRWGPPPDDRHVVLWKGGTGDPHADEPDPGLLKITVDDVLEAAAAV
jgi:ADP-heptose:LPS heptosyltransferase